MNPLAGTRGRGAVAAFAVLMVMPDASASQQDTIVIHGTCSDCEIRLEPIATLGGADLPFEVDFRSSVAVMSDGSFLVAPTMNTGEVGVFDPAGQFERVVGREGQGPGEYQRISTIRVGPGDTVHVIEYGLVSKLGPDLAFLNRMPLQSPPPDQWTVLPSGDLVVLAVRLGGNTPPMRLHVMGRDGRYVTSFAPAPRAYSRTDDHDERIGALWPSRRYGGLWYAKQNRYALDLYVDHEPQRSIVRELDWFQPWEGDLPGEGFQRPPRPQLTSIAERPDGLLTVVINRADANWQELPRTGTLDRNRVFDGVIEVLDPVAGEVIATMETEDRIAGVIGDGTLIYIARQDSVGRVRIYVYRIVLPESRYGTHRGARRLSRGVGARGGDRTRSGEAISLPGRPRWGCSCRRRAVADGPGAGAGRTRPGGACGPGPRPEPVKADETLGGLHLVPAALKRGACCPHGGRELGRLGRPLSEPLGMGLALRPTVPWPSLGPIPRRDSAGPRLGRCIVQSRHHRRG
jgi:hypothetical protein